MDIAVPAQPADFQAKAESDTRIQLSWLLPPQERIVKYELVYWAAEEEGQQVSHETEKSGRRLSPVPGGLWWAHKGRLQTLDFPAALVAYVVL